MPMLTRRARLRGISRLALPLVATLAIAGCGGDDPVRPASPVGEYAATTFTATSGGTTTDVLAEGGNIMLVITPQGTTTGHLFVPASVSGEGDVDEDLTGTWAQSGGTVHLAHAADTFLRDMPFTVQRGTLVGDQTFGTLRLRVTLARGPWEL
jgi:hypothetical protein